MKDTYNQNWINKETSMLKKEGLYINIRTLNSPLNGNIKINGYDAINFSSNNYLGLANNNSLKNAAKKAIDRYGVSSAAVRTIAGTTKLHNELETRLANFKKVQSIITLQSGYAANIATIPAIVGKDDHIFSDELNHASIIDGCRLSRATVIKYKHLTADDLENKIKDYGGSSRKLIVTDGVFSMNGDIAPLDKLTKIAHKYKAMLMVDDAHGEGVLGKHGRGIVDHFKLHGQVDLEIGTMSKAFGVIGGYVAGNREMIDWLKQRARTFLFSSAMTIPDTAACIAAVKILESSNSRVTKLWKNTKFFKVKMSKIGFDIGNSETPIIPIMLGKASIAQKFSQELLKNGVFAMSIGYPTVPKGKARIRVILSASHTQKDLAAALEIFRAVGKTLHILYK